MMMNGRTELAWSSRLWRTSKPTTESRLQSQVAGATDVSGLDGSLALMRDLARKRAIRTLMSRCGPFVRY